MVQARADNTLDRMEVVLMEMDESEDLSLLEVKTDTLGVP